MKKAKGIWGILLCMALFLSACGGSTSSSSATSGSSDASSTGASTNSTSASAASADTSGGDGETLTFQYFAMTMEVEWLLQIEEALKELGETYNFELLTSDANYDINTQLSQIDTAITQGIDGAFLFIVDEGSATAAIDKFNAAGIPVIGETLKLQDGNGNNVAPYVELDAEAVGGECGTWIAENWENCGIEISDWSKVGVISNTQTTRQSDLSRSTGFENALKAGLPEIPEENYLIADNAAEANNNDAENSYNQVSAVLAAHPEIETWFVIGTVDNYAMGACRAIEAAGLEDQTILVSCGGEYAVREWAEGTGSCWRAACYYEAMDFAVEMVDGMLQIVRDGVPATDIYDDSRAEGQEYAAVGITGTMITPDNYTEYVSE